MPEIEGDSVRDDTYASIGASSEGRRKVGCWGAVYLLLLMVAFVVAGRFDKDNRGFVIVGSGVFYLLSFFVRNRWGYAALLVVAVLLLLVVLPSVFWQLGLIR